MLDKFYEFADWKRDGKWCYTEVVIDVVIVGCTIAICIGLWGLS